MFFPTSTTVLFFLLAFNPIHGYHPPKTSNDENSIPHHQPTAQQQQLITREECANQYSKQQQQQQQQQQQLSPFIPPYTPVIGASSQLPLPVLNNYVDSRYVNILPPLPGIVDVGGFSSPGVIRQNPVSPKPAGSPEPSAGQNPQLVNQANNFNNFAGGGLLPPLQATIASTVPFGQDRKFIRSGLEVAFQWRFLDWTYPNTQLTGKNFTIGNPLTQDVDIDRRGRIFVTTPQWLSGVPITLSTLTSVNGPGGPLLTPYPDWTWHRTGCDSLVSVYRVAIDECDRLWLVDTGSSSGQSICPMKIIAFDLKTDKPILIYQIPESQTVGRTASYINPIIEVGDTCNDTFMYVADVIKHGMLIYSLRENRSWRLDNRLPGNAFGNDPEANTMSIAGESFTLTDGTLGMSLSPRGFFSKRYLYFNSLASFYQKYADSDSLKRSFVYEPIIYQSLSKRISQAGVQATSRTGAIFFQLAQFTALACWNIERPFVPENVVVLARDETTLQYISGIKVITNDLGVEELWFNTNRLQKTINNSRRNDEINFRLVRGNVDELIRGTRCEGTGFRGAEPSLQGWKRV